MQTLRNRPLTADRPAWVSAADWLLIQDRVRELADERKAARQAKSQKMIVQLPDPEELDSAWAQDHRYDEPATRSMGGPRPRSTKISDDERERMERQADCTNCGHTYRTFAIVPTCSHCNSKALKLGPWEPRIVRGKRPATCRKCGYEWLTTCMSRPTCTACNSKSVNLLPPMDET